MSKNRELDMERVVIYSRVSTTDQTCENQIKLLQSIVDQNGWELIDTYIDQGISGSKGRDKRPEFDRLCKDMVRRRFDKVMVWDVSRLGRSLQHLVEFLNDVQSLNCHLYIHQSGLDTSTPSGRMMFQMVGVFSEFEREMISERVKLGLERVKSNGKKLGRPQKINRDVIENIWLLHSQGYGLQLISNELNIGRSSVYRTLKTTLSTQTPLGASQKVTGSLLIHQS